MIPLQISIENFMCYKERLDELNLEDIHVACLSGKNGHGKTALLDAITWVLWGKSRARTQNELLHQGENSMQVILDFASQTQKYRVTRIHTKGKGSSSGKTELNLEILLNGSATSIMGNTIRDTEHKIIKLLNLDYETFINTSYLRQGDADHFTKSNPSERKQILSEVLDLSYYEHLENISKEKSKKFKNEVANKKAIVSSKSLDISDKSYLQEKLRQAELKITKLTPKEQELSIYYSSLLSKKETLSRDKLEQNRLNSSIENSLKEFKELTMQLDNWTKEISDLENLIKRSDEISNKKIDLDNMKLLLSKYDEDLIKLKDFEKELIILEQSIYFEEEMLSKDLITAKSLYESKLKPALTEIEILNQQIAIIEKEKSVNNIALESLASKITAKEKISLQIKELEIQNKNLESNMNETRNKFNILEQVNAICPICEQNLDPNSKKTITFNLEKSGLESKTIYIENTHTISEFQIQLDLHTYEINNDQKKITDLNKILESKLIESNMKLHNCNDLITQIPEVVKRITEITHIIEDGNFKLPEREKKSKISKNISMISYNPEEHMKIKKEYIQLKEYEELYVHLEQARQRTELITTLISENSNSAQKRKSEIAIWKSDLSEIETRLTDAIDIESEINDSVTKLKSIRENVQNQVSEKSILNNQIESISKTEKDINDLNTKIKSDSKEIEIYDELAFAFGRNGIQALLIERSVPQIQNTANELLSRLTHNRMAIKLTFQKGRIDRLTGLHSEELDISISDEIGTRNYETFSGGETFRIDFAIRIALSKLLASRSGAPLPILFIDEGFGSQDSEGQEKLIEAIQSIQNDFEKIIVITHIDQMKENFDQIIEVTKSGTGSKIQII